MHDAATPASAAAGRGAMGRRDSCSPVQCKLRMSGTAEPGAKLLRAVFFRPGAAGACTAVETRAGRVAGGARARGGGARPLAVPRGPLSAREGVVAGGAHRVGQNCVTLPPFLSENPYQRPELGPRVGPTLRTLGPAARGRPAARFGAGESVRPVALAQGRAVIFAPPFAVPLGILHVTRKMECGRTTARPPGRWCAYRRGELLVSRGVLRRGQVRKTPS